MCEAPSAARVGTIAGQTLVAFAASCWWLTPSASVPEWESSAHTLECSCEVELREIIHQKDLLDWWRWLAILLSLILVLCGLITCCAGIFVFNCCRAWCGRRPVAKAEISVPAPLPEPSADLNYQAVVVVTPGSRRRLP